MKNKQFGESKAHRFFSGKGFYIALAVSLVAVGGAAWLGVNSAIDQLASDEDKTPSQNQIVDNDEWKLPSDFEVNKPQSDVPASKPEASSEPASSEEPEPANTAVEQGCILPLKGEVINPFSGDKVVKSKTLDQWCMHTGVDISAAIGTPVKAMSAGVVKEVFDDTQMGTQVKIEHPNGLISYYANLKPAVTVKVGQSVKLGDVIGEVGETAANERADGEHLHFGVMQNGEWIDPVEICK